MIDIEQSLVQVLHTSGTLSTTSSLILTNEYNKMYYQNIHTCFAVNIPSVNEQPNADLLTLTLFLTSYCHHRLQDFADGWQHWPQHSDHQS